MYRPSIDDVAAVLALAPHDQPWRLEGPCRHRVRVILLTIGWTRSWHRADLEARRLVVNGRVKNGVREPRGWDAPTDLSSWIGSIECAICGKTVLQKKHNQVYCSRQCKTRANYIGSTKVALLRCGECNEMFEGKTVEAKYCSAACRQKVHQYREKLHSRRRRAAAKGMDLCDRTCKICSGPLSEDAHQSAEFCSDECRHENRLRWKRDAYRRANDQATTAPNGAADHPRSNGCCRANGPWCRSRWRWTRSRERTRPGRRGRCTRRRGGGARRRS